MKNEKLLLLFSILSFTLSAQDIKLKKETTEREIAYIQGIFENISITDQKYRSFLSYETMDETIITKIDSLIDNVGIEAGLTYSNSLNLSLNQELKDSLILLQDQIDLQNHMILRGVWDTYGFIPKSIIEEKNYVQQLLLVHPPGTWDVRKFQQTYAEMLIEEVKVGRMPAKTYATFYDNMLCKILREPQLYGTNQQFDPEKGEVLPPIIKDLAEANEARAAIGMPLLEDGEYRLAE
ncbi:MAG: hypothetical protein ACI8YQ_003955 [Polaribacter sp.]|jgi:hypothetical protein